MNRTVHKKLTEKHLYTHTASLAGTFMDEEMRLGLRQEIKILHEASKDLLQPRPQAIANLLKAAKNV